MTFGKWHQSTTYERNWITSSLSLSPSHSLSFQNSFATFSLWAHVIDERQATRNLNMYILGHTACALFRWEFSTFSMNIDHGTDWIIYWTFMQVHNCRELINLTKLYFWIFQIEFEKKTVSGCGGRGSCNRCCRQQPLRTTVFDLANLMNDFLRL